MLGQTSYVCSSSGTCKEVAASPGQPLFSNLSACNEICNPLQPAVSYACSPGLGCHLMHSAPDAANGLYSTMESCSATCKTPSQPAISYGCSPGLGCHLMQSTPDPANGLYSNMENCLATCKTPSPGGQNLKCSVTCALPTN